jgi:hypothetical protein
VASSGTAGAASNERTHARAIEGDALTVWTYKQSTGELFAADGTRVGIGYAGHGEGVNDPAMESIANIGPIPRGRWHIGVAYSHEHLGPFTMNLTPDPETETYGRTEFRIHGDAITAPGTASHGCIVQDHAVRTLVSQSGDRELEVIA